MPVARLTEKKGLDKKGVQQIKQLGLDALSLPTHVNYELNMQRTQLMKPDIEGKTMPRCAPSRFLLLTICLVTTCKSS